MQRLIFSILVLGLLLFGSLSTRPAGLVLAQAQPLALSLVVSDETPARRQLVSVAASVYWDQGAETHTVELSSTLGGDLAVEALDGRCTANGAALACVVQVSQARPASLVLQLRVRATAAPGTRTLEVSAADQADTTTAVTQRVALQITSANAEPTTLVTATPTSTSAATATPTRTAAPASTTAIAATSIPQATATALPAAYSPDRCEPNNSLTQPCALPTEVDTAGLTFVDDAIDVYSFLLKGGRTYTIRAASADGIDPSLTLYLAGATEQVIDQNDDAAPGSGDAVIQITPLSEAWYLVQVDNKAPGDMRNRTYTLSARSSAPAPGSGAPAATPTPAPPGDAYENNYSVETAKRLGSGVPYDLSLICPEPGACRSGDHDFFLVPVKNGVPFLAVTYDLGPGADTTLTLYRPESNFIDPSTGLVGWRMLQGNDDIAPGRTLRSQVVITPNWTGDALLVVAASDRHDPPAVPEAVGPSGRYRLITGSPSLASVQAVLSAQQDLPVAPTRVPGSGGNGSGSNGGGSPLPQPSTQPPSPTAAPAGTPASAPTPGQSEDAEEIVREDCTSGLAVVGAPEGAMFYSAGVPSSDKRYLAAYPAGSRIELLGSCYLGWVKVQPKGSVTPGWMFGPDLLLEAAQEAPAGSPIPSEVAPPGDGSAPTAHAAPPATPARIPTVVAVTPTPIPAPAPAQRQALTVQLQLVDTAEQPLADVRVQLSNVFGDTLAEAVTRADGTIALPADVAPGTALYVRVPALGLSEPVDPSKPTLTITVPTQEVAS